VTNLPLADVQLQSGSKHHTQLHVVQKHEELSVSEQASRTIACRLDGNRFWIVGVDGRQEIDCPGPLKSSPADGDGDGGGRNGIAVPG